MVEEQRCGAWRGGADRLACLLRGAIASTKQRLWTGHALAHAVTAVSSPPLQASRSGRPTLVVAQAAAAEVEAAPEPVAVADGAEAVAHLRYLRMQPSKVSSDGSRILLACTT